MDKSEVMERLDSIESAMEYTRATVSSGNLSHREGEWARVHAGRASSSERQLTHALRLLEEIRTMVSA